VKEEEESESEDEECAAAAAVEEEEEEEDEDSTEEGDEEEAEPDLQPPSKRIDPPVTAALKAEVQEDVDFQPSNRIDQRAPARPAEAEESAAKNLPPARGRKRASGEIGKSLVPAPARKKSKNTAQHSESPEPRPKRIRRVWASDDEALVLEALAQHRRQHGSLPPSGDCGFFESIREGLEEKSFQHSDIKDKVRSLLRRYRSCAVSTSDHDKRIRNLSRDVWGDLLPVVAATGPVNGSEEAAISGDGQSENGGRRSGTKGSKRMCEMYPLLAQEVKLLAKVQPCFESSFARLDAKRAQDIEKRLERVKYAELKIESRMVLEVHAPKAKISKKLISLLTKVSKNV
jgi:hypothetical protein